MVHLPWFRLAIHLGEEVIPVAYGAHTPFPDLPYANLSAVHLFPQQIYDAVFNVRPVRLPCPQFPPAGLIPCENSAIVKK